MKSAVLLFTLTLCAAAQAPIRPAAAVVPLQAKPVARTTLVRLEQQFDSRINALGGLQPFLLLGSTRGIHLAGYGVVFTAELDLIQTPGVTPMRPTFKPEEIARIHKLKVDHLALLYQAMKEMMASAATALPDLPAQETIVFAVRLDYRSYEDTSGLPAQVLMSATRAGAASGAITVDLQ